MLGFIPVGVRYDVTVSGRAAKHVRCESCGCEFVYVSVREASGSFANMFEIATERYAKARAVERARRKMETRLEAPELVPCPECGRYQPHMIRYLKNRVLEYCGTGAGLSTLVAWLVCDGLGVDHSYSLAISLALGLIGLAILAVWHVRYAPNSRMTEAELRARARATKALPVDKYLERQAIRAQDRAQSMAQESAFLDGPAENTKLDESALDWLGAGAADELRMNRKQAQANQRRFKGRQGQAAILAAIMIAAAAALGAILDESWFGAGSNQLWDRAGMALVIGSLGGGIGLIMARSWERQLSRSAAFRRWQSSTTALRLRGPFAGDHAIGLATMAVVAAWVIGGRGHSGTIRGHAVVIGSEAIVFIFAWLLWRARNATESSSAPDSSRPTSADKELLDKHGLDRKVTFDYSLAGWMKVKSYPKRIAWSAAILWAIAAVIVIAPHGVIAQIARKDAAIRHNIAASPLGKLCWQCGAPAVQAAEYTDGSIRYFCAAHNPPESVPDDSSGGHQYSRFDAREIAAFWCLVFGLGVLRILVHVSSRGELFSPTFVGALIALAVAGIAWFLAHTPL